MKREIQPEGNYYDKYNTQNKIEQWIMNRFFLQVRRNIGYSNAGAWKDFGSGVWRREFYTLFIRKICDWKMRE